MRQLLDTKIMAGVAGGVVVGVLLSGMFVCWRVFHHQRTADINFGETHIAAQIVDTPDTREHGLSGTTSLKPQTGMLFIFDQPGSLPMWMKDMKYPLDILWLDHDRKVVHIERNLSPQTYPENFSSPMPALYVLEVPSGFADAHQLREGSSAQFSFQQ
ncbi:MAG TPA: DUF192 domain-containing protein [Candidatus Saccharimonadales bacterium]|nr:DUF192 domain-containing protein [Candidatus Saccharimonadales bacterium]